MPPARHALATALRRVAATAPVLALVAGCLSREPAWPTFTVVDTMEAGASQLAIGTAFLAGVNGAGHAWLAERPDGVASASIRPLTLPARFGAPPGLAVASDGSLLLSDPEHHRVWRVSPGQPAITKVFAGSGTDFQPIGDRARAVGAQLSRPAALATLGGDTWLADPGFRRVRRIDAEGRIDTVLGSGLKGAWPDQPTPLRLPLPEPGALAVGPDARLAVADGRHGVVVSGPGDRIARWPETGISGLAWLGDGTLVAARGPAIIGWRGGGTKVLLDGTEPITALCGDGGESLWCATATRTVRLRVNQP